MARYTQDMTKVEKWGETAAEGWYHVRVDKGEERISDNSNEPMWCLWLKSQAEPTVGRVLFDIASLQPQALAKLKAYYDACGVEYDSTGHDPELLNGKECFVLVQHDMYQGQKRAKIPPFGIKSMSEGPGGTLVGQ